MGGGCIELAEPNFIEPASIAQNSRHGLTVPILRIGVEGFPRRWLGDSIDATQNRAVVSDKAVKNRQIIADTTVFDSAKKLRTPTYNA